jgi:hypothetical protein
MCVSESIFKLIRMADYGYTVEEGEQPSEVDDEDL